MARFVLTAQLQLAAPNNVGAVVRQIQSQLSGINVSVTATGADAATKQINSLTTATKSATQAGASLGHTFGRSIKRFAAFSIATRAISLLTQGLGGAVSEAIDFEREMIKVSQVTGKTMRELKGLSNTVRDLATSLGVGSKELLSVARILAQTGLSARETEIALTALAKTELAPTFENITQTAEGAVAIINQFKQGVEALEAQLGAINAVAGQFAVEAGDLIAVIRRTGGVFKSAGGDLNELIALFTSVRATTRESAESIATGLRTIFTRIQRPKTIQFLKDMGVQLTDLNGRFVGPYEAVRRLNAALVGLKPGDLKFIEIAEQLGGFRQIGKVLPLLQEFTVAEQARQAAMDGSNSLTEDAATAQEALSIRLTALKEKFLELMAAVVGSPTFMVMANAAIALAENLLMIADALKHLLPLLAALAAIKLTSGIAGFMGGMKGGMMSKGGMGFNRGGLVPGTGSRDTVPAVLTPGEFVVRKQSVQAIGADRLAKMNRYAAGGKVTGGRNYYGGIRDYAVAVLDKPKQDSKQLNFKAGGGSLGLAQGKSFTDAMVLSGMKTQAKGYPVGGKPMPDQFARKALADTVMAQGSSATYRRSSLAEEGGLLQHFRAGIDKGLINGIDAAAAAIAPNFPGTVARKTPESQKKTVLAGLNDAAVGDMFENVLTHLSGEPYDNTVDPKRPFDFTTGLGAAQQHFPGIQGASLVEAKGSWPAAEWSGMQKKLINQAGLDAVRTAMYKGQLKEEQTKLAQQTGTLKRNKGGGVYGTDTVPALLTPGEFVINRKSAQSIGYGNLANINRYAAGGKVSAGRHAYGNSAQGQLPLSKAMSGGGDGGGSQAMQKLTQEMQKMVPHIEKVSTMFSSTLLQALEKVATFLSGTGLQAYQKVSDILAGGLLTGLDKFQQQLMKITGPLSTLIEAMQFLVRQFNGVASVIGGTLRPALSKAVQGVNSVTQAFMGLPKLIQQLPASFKNLQGQVNNATGSLKHVGTAGASLKLLSEVAPVVAAGMRSIAEVAPNLAQSVRVLFEAVSSTSSVLMPPFYNAISKVGGHLIKLAQALASSMGSMGKFKVSVDKASASNNKEATGSGATEAFRTAMGEAALAATTFATAMAQLGGLITAALQPMAQMMVSLGLLGQEEVDAAMDTKRLGAEAAETGAKLGQTGDKAKQAGAGMMAMLGPLMAVEMLLGMLGGALDETTSTIGRLGQSLIKGVSVFVMLFMIVSMLNMEEKIGLTLKALSATATEQEILAREALIATMQKQLMMSLMAAGAMLALAIAFKSFMTSMADHQKKMAEEGLTEGTMDAATASTELYAAQNKKLSGTIMMVAGVLGALAIVGMALSAAKIFETTSAIGAAIALSAVAGPFVLIGVAVMAVIAIIVALTAKFDFMRDAVSFLTFGMVESSKMVKLRANHEAAVLDAERKSKEAKEANSKVMEDLTNGTITAAEAMVAFSNAGIQAAAAVLAARKALVDEQKEFSMTREILHMATGGIFGMSGLVDSNEARNEGIDKENAADFAKERAALLSEIGAQDKMMNKRGRDLILATGGGATSKDQFMKERRAAAGPENMKNLSFKQQQELQKSWSDAFDNMQKEIEHNIKRYAALNFQLRASESAVNLATTRMNNFTASLEVGFNPLQNSLNTLTDVLQNSANAITDAEMDKAIKDVTGAMMAFGGDTNRVDIFGQTLKGFNVVQQHFESAMKTVQAKLKSQGESFNPEQIEKEYKEEMTKALKGAGISDKAIARIMDTVKLDPKQLERLQQGDMTVMDELTEEQRKNVEKQLEQVQKIIELQNVVIDLTKERIQLERRALTAQKKAIDLNLEAAEIAARHGGKAVTPDMRRQSVLDKANVGAGRLGLGNMGTGSVAEIRQRNAQIMGNFSTLETRGRSGGFSGVAGVEQAGRRDELMKAQQDHVKMIKDLIKVEEQELKLIEKKNELEKKSMEQLLKGDLEGFLKDQAAVGATAAVATGSAGLMGLFGAEALAGAFTNIQQQANAGQQSLFGQQLQGSGGLMERAGGAALSARGMGGDHAAQMLAGTGAEAEAKRRNIRGLAGELGAAGQTGADMAQMQVNTAKLHIREARIIVNKAITDAGTPGVINKAMGGLIYASQGMFVPRGTDTVPAMLTPGEFVVNRAAVNRGNNLQLLRAMNGTARGYSGGGAVGYYHKGDKVGKRRGGGGMDGASMQNFSVALTNFNTALKENLDRLERSKITFKLEATNVTVNLAGGSFLASLKDELKGELLAEIGDQIHNQSFNMAGESTFDASVIG